MNAKQKPKLRPRYLTIMEPALPCLEDTRSVLARGRWTKRRTGAARKAAAFDRKKKTKKNRKKKKEEEEKEKRDLG